MQCGPILAIYDIPHIAQVHIYHLARLLNPDSVRPGYESLDTQLLPWCVTLSTCFDVQL